MMKWCIVVPTNRPERYAKFREAWDAVVPEGTRFITMVDAEEIAPEYLRFSGDIHCQLSGELPDFIPHGTDMIRSWAIYKAWQTDCDYVLSLDDDCMPPSDHPWVAFSFFREYEHVFEAGAPCSPYFDVGAMTTFDGQMRGFPFADRERRPVPIQYGGWNKVLDFDAVTQLSRTNSRPNFFNGSAIPVPRGAAVTCCAMNMAWRREFSPIMWQLPLYEGRYNRFGDIWSGLIQKKVLDAMGLPMVINGKARVIHERASDPLANIVREAPGIPHNEKLWGELDAGESVSMMGAWVETTNSLFRYFREVDDPYANRFLGDRNAWLALFS